MMGDVPQDVLMELLANAIATRKRGDDAYQRWPLDLLVGLQRCIKQLEAENVKLRNALDHEKERKRQAVDDALTHLRPDTGER